MAHRSYSSFLFSLCFFGLSLCIDHSRSDAVYQNATDTLQRSSRAADCHVRFAKITKGHSACLPPSPDVKATGVTDAEIKEIVDIHNMYRTAVFPEAANMLKLTWDSELAKTAQRWASNCVIGKHDENIKRYDFGRFPVGQNLVWGIYKFKWAIGIQNWAFESDFFRYGRENSMSRTGHYTQVVWGTTAKVGCGYAQCADTHYYVCNYAPAGNRNFSHPYRLGKSCEDCPGRCEKRLCDCKGNVCLNGGVMQMRTCSCVCTLNLTFYMQPDCALDCDNVKQPFQCAQYSQGGCEESRNVAIECPKKCYWCPYAANLPRSFKDVSGVSGVHIFNFRSFHFILPLVAAILWSTSFSDMPGLL